MRMSWMRQPVVLVVGAAVAFATAFWADDFHSRWRAVCAITFSPDGRTLAAGCYSGKSFNENFHWCIADLRQAVSVFDTNTGATVSVVDEARFDGTGVFRHYGPIMSPIFLRSCRASPPFFR